MSRNRLQMYIDIVPQFTLYYADEDDNWEFSKADGMPWDADRKLVQGVTFGDGDMKSYRLTDSDVYIYDVAHGVFVPSDHKQVQDRIDEDIDFIAFYAREVTDPQFNISRNRQMNDERYFGFITDPEKLQTILQTAVDTGDYRLIETARMSAVVQGYHLEDIDPITLTPLFEALSRKLARPVGES